MNEFYFELSRARIQTAMATISAESLEQAMALFRARLEQGVTSDELAVPGVITIGPWSEGVDSGPLDFDFEDGREDGAEDSPKENNDEDL